MNNKNLEHSIPEGVKNGVKDTQESQETARSNEIQHERSQSKPLHDQGVLPVWKFLLFFLVMAIPIINLILTIRWSFSRNINKNLQNISRSMLILFLVALVPYLFVLLL